MENFVLISISEHKLNALIRQAVKSVLHEYQQGTAEPAVPEEKFLDKRATAAILSCSVATVDNMKRAGELPFYRIGSAVRFKLSEVLEAVEKKKANRGSLHSKNKIKNVR